MAGQGKRGRKVGRWSRKPANKRYGDGRRERRKLINMRRSNVCLEDAKAWHDKNRWAGSQKFFDSLGFIPRDVERQRLRRERSLQEIEQQIASVSARVSKAEESVRSAKGKKEKTEAAEQLKLIRRATDIDSLRRRKVKREQWLRRA